MKIPFLGRRPNPTAVRLAGLGAGLVVLWLAGSHSRAFLWGKSVSALDPVRVRMEDLVMSVEAEGELAAVRSTEIGPPPVKDLWDYKIAFLVPESARVKRGQPVLGFDAQQLQKNLEEKRAEFQEASKEIERREIELSIQIHDQELELAEAEAKLGKEKLKSDIPEELRGQIEAQVALLDLDEAQRQVSRLEAKLESTRGSGKADLRSFRSKRDRAKGRVEDLESAIAAMMVKAPQDGVIIYKTNWRDEKKKVGDSTWIGEKILEIPDLAEMKAEAMVDEADAGQVAVGHKVTLHLEARPDLDFTGRVFLIGRTVSRKSWRMPVKVYKIGVTLDRTDPAVMRPAMRFRGEIETQRIPNLLVAAREAIFLRPAGPVAWVKKRSGWREVPVKLGRSNKRLVEILSGLSDGDLISPADMRPPERKRTAPLGEGT